MANERKDSRGYALRTGECQRNDGRYSFSYTNRLGERHFIYAKTLVELRTREKKIMRDIDDGINPRIAETMTLNQLYARYMDGKSDSKASTNKNYIYSYNHFVRETFGKKRIATIKYSDVKHFYYSMLMKKQLKPNTLETIHTQLHPAFQLAVRDEILRKNPSDGVMAEIKKSRMWERPKRHSLTVPQQTAFINFLENNYEYHGWLPIITVLLGTGTRIGECLGLTWKDLDFDNRTISINHTLTYRPD